MTTDSISTWDEVRRLADELELKLHLARMDVRDRWLKLQPQLVSFEKRMRDAGERAGKTVSEELESLRDAIRRLRDDLEN